MGKTPSRKRYEEENPVVAFRVSKETKESLDELVEQLDTTKKAWFERIVAEEKQDVDAAWERGYEAAKEEFMLEIPCVICEEPMPIVKNETKEKIRDIVMAAAHDDSNDLFYWRGHQECL